MSVRVLSWESSRRSLVLQCGDTCEETVTVSTCTMNDAWILQPMTASADAYKWHKLRDHTFGKDYGGIVESSEHGSLKLVNDWCGPEVLRAPFLTSHGGRTATHMWLISMLSILAIAGIVNHI